MRVTLSMIIGMMGMILLAQPVFEKTYDESTSICHLESLGDVYYSMDVINKRCLISNMDHTLLKSISLPTPEGYYLEDIQYVSEHLFNDDELIELVYIYSKYVPTDFSYYFTFETRLINENGVDLLALPSGAGFTELIETVEHGKKFLVYKYDYSVIPYRTSTYVYALPEEEEPAASYDITGFSPGNAYPNPGHEQVNIPVSLPEGVYSGSLEIMDMNGRKILSYPVTASMRHLQLSTRQMPPGTYLYQLNAGQVQSGVKKIVIR